MARQNTGPCVVCGKVGDVDLFDKTCSPACSYKKDAHWRPARVRHLRLAQKYNLARGQIRVRSRGRRIEGRLVGVSMNVCGAYAAKVLTTTGVVVLLKVGELDLHVADLKQHAL